MIMKYRLKKVSIILIDSLERWELTIFIIKWVLNQNRFGTLFFI